jgi:large repetitive protein
LPQQNGTTTFTYTLSDGHGGSATATVTVTVTPVNDPPVAVDDALTTPEDAALVMAPGLLLVNDRDPDGDPLTLVSVQSPVNGTVVFAGGVITFTPAPNFFGIASFTYTMRDPDGLTSTAKVTVTVTAVPDPPVANNDSATTAEDTPLVLAVSTLLANDVNVDGDALTVVSVGSAVHGTVALSGGTVTFTPAPDFHGLGSFTYTVRNAAGLMATATVAVTITPVQDPPVARNDAITTDEDVALDITPATLLANDTDVDGDPLSVVAVGNAVNGTVALVNGSVRFTPAPNFFGVASFTYTISDGHGGMATATVIVTVRPVNDAPVALPDSATVIGTAAVTIDALANDADVDTPHANLRIIAVTPLTGGTSGQMTIAADGRSLRYAATTLVDGTATYRYTISDGQLTAQAIVTLTLIANRAPVCGTAFGGEIWPPNHKRFYAAPVYGVTDPDGDPLNVRVLGVYQDEPVDAMADGNFSADAAIQNGTAWVRAERMGSGDGRVYEIAFEATDARGGACQGSVFWTVPKSQGQPHTLIDSGVRYDSFAKIPGTIDKRQIHKEGK